MVPRGHGGGRAAGRGAARRATAANGMTTATFACFGGTCSVDVIGEGASDAVEHARRTLLSWHRRFTRFDSASELSRVNADPRPELPVSRTMAQLVEAIVAAAVWTGGLVDGTLLREIEAAGYRGDFNGGP